MVAGRLPHGGAEYRSANVRIDAVSQDQAAPARLGVSRLPVEEPSTQILSRPPSEEETENFRRLRV
jgi:hypothetical protein